VLEIAPKELDVGSQGKGRTRGQLLPAVVWRLSSAFAAVVLSGLLFLVGPGSVDIVARAPVSGRHLAETAPSWTRPCFRQQISARDPKLAFCARVVGLVLGSRTKGGEPHVLVSGGFHFTLVELRSGARVPPLGSHITAVGPLVRGEWGLRELKGLWESH
jgi:hypothetical protein